MRDAARADRPVGRGPLPLPLRARQGARGRAGLRRARSSTTRRATALRRAAIHYDADRTSASVRRSRELFSADFLAERAGAGAPAADPIFIVGLPRAGSTLVEQILASHSLVEGTMELPDIAAIVRASGPRATGEAVALSGGRSRDWAATQLRALGERYLAQTRIQRKTGRAVLHRQDAEQLGARRPDPADPAERADHRRAPPSAELLLLRLQAALRPRPGLHLRPRGPRPLLPRLRRADGALRRGAAGPRPPRASTSGWSRTPRPRCAGCSTTAASPFEDALPALLRERARGAHRQLRAGALADLPRRRRPLAQLRAVARAARDRRSDRCSRPTRTHRRFEVAPEPHQNARTITRRGLRK